MTISEVAVSGDFGPENFALTARFATLFSFITLTIVFLIQNYRAFVRERLAKIPISSPEFLIFGDRRR